MDINFNKDEAEILDVILKTALEKGNANYRNLPPLDKGQFSNIKDIKKAGYIDYFEILKNFNSYIEIGNGLERDECYAKPNNRTKDFLNKGGFINLFNTQEQKHKRDLEIEELKYNKAKSDYKQSKWYKYVIWATLVVSIISLLIQIFK